MKRCVVPIPKYRDETTTHLEVHFKGEGEDDGIIFVGACHFRWTHIYLSVTTDGDNTYHYPIKFVEKLVLLDSKEDGSGEHRWLELVFEPEEE